MAALYCYIRVNSRSEPEQPETHYQAGLPPLKPRVGGWGASVVRGNNAAYDTRWILGLGFWLAVPGPWSWSAAPVTTPVPHIPTATHHLQTRPPHPSTPRNTVCVLHRISPLDKEEGKGESLAQFRVASNGELEAPEPLPG